MEEIEGTVELHELDEVTDKRPGTKDRVEEFLRKIRGADEPRVVPRCYHCGGELLNGRPVPVSVSRELIVQHLRERHPDLQPRSREEVLKDHERREREVKREKERRREAERRKVGKKPSSFPNRQRIRRVGRRIEQPVLTEETIREAIELYAELKSVRRVADVRYLPWGFSSAKALRLVLYEAFEAFREQGVSTLTRPPNVPRLTEEQFNEAKRLCEEEKVTVREIAGMYHLAWGYSHNGLRNTLYRMFRKRGVDCRHLPRKKGVKRTGVRNKITPERLHVAWQLYSEGNYYLQEITEMVSGVWGHLGHGTLGQTLRRHGYKLRNSKWENDGSRPISKREAMKLIRSVK